MDNKTTTLVAAWFGAALASVLFSISFFVYLSTEKRVEAKNQDFRLYAAIPARGKQISQNINFSDGRSLLVRNFLTDYGSPLASFSRNFIEVADKYQLDFRLLPAIAMQESIGGKKVIKDSNNPFGYGIYGNLVIRFNTWEEAIERVGKALREDYLNQGLKTPTQIMAKYTPPSLAKDGVWAKGVSSFMQQLH